MTYSLTEVLLTFFLYSFLGWAQETVQCSIKERRFVNRGFLNGPICPIYGCGALLILCFLLPIERRAASLWISVPLVFVCGAFIASALEYMTSWAMEKLFHSRWWDYSDKKWNVNGRICFWISVGWGLLSIVLVFGIQPLFESWLAALTRFQPLIPILLAWVLAGLMIVDIVFSVRAALSIGNRLEQLEKLRGVLREHLENLEWPTEDIFLRLENAYDKSRQKKMAVQNSRQARLNAWRSMKPEDKRRHIAGMVAELRGKQDELLRSRFQQRRLLRAFPHMRRTDKEDRAGKNRLLEELRKHLNKDKTAGKSDPKDRSSRG